MNYHTIYRLTADEDLKYSVRGSEWFLVRARHSILIRANVLSGLEMRARYGEPQYHMELVQTLGT